MSVELTVVARTAFTAQLRRDVEATYGRTCWLCWDPVPAGQRVSLDHVQPQIFGGTNDLENLRPSHGACNRARSEWDVGTYYAAALLSGRPERLHQVPPALREVVAHDARERLAQARTHYHPSQRRPDLPPYGGSWAFASPHRTLRG